MAKSGRVVAPARAEIRAADALAVEQEAGLQIDPGVAVDVDAHPRGAHRVGAARLGVLRIFEVAAAHLGGEFARGPLAAQGQLRLAAQRQGGPQAGAADLVRVRIVADALGEGRQQREGAEPDAERRVGGVGGDRPAQSRAEQQPGGVRQAEPEDRRRQRHAGDGRLDHRGEAQIRDRLLRARLGDLAGRRAEPARGCRAQAQDRGPGRGAPRRGGAGQARRAAEARQAGHTRLLALLGGGGRILGRAAAERGGGGEGAGAAQSRRRVEGGAARAARGRRLGGAARERVRRRARGGLGLRRVGRLLRQRGGPEQGGEQRQSERPAAPPRLSPFGRSRDTGSALSLDTAGGPWTGRRSVSGRRSMVNGATPGMVNVPLRGARSPCPAVSSRRVAPMRPQSRVMRADKESRGPGAGL